jgi:acyl dehydratase
VPLVLADRYEVVAFNTATESLNKIHDDAVAKNLGFRGGLVPGVDVFAYLCHLPAENWGRDWIGGGAISARFESPVYDGDTVEVIGEPIDDGTALDLTVFDPSGVGCAVGVALQSAPDAAPPLDSIGVAEVPSRLATASPEAFAAFAGGVLGTLEYGFHADVASQYLSDVRESHPVFDGVAHPGWLLRMANWALTHNVRLGPWIHVGSSLQLHGLVVDGDRVSVRSRVADVTDRKGHGFVDLDVLWVVGDRVVASARHTAIYEPRGVRESRSAG